MHLDAVLSAEQDSTAGLVHLIATCHRAAFPGGDPEAAEQAIDEQGGRLELELRMFLRFELYQVTGTARLSILALGLFFLVGLALLAAVGREPAAD